MGRPALTEDQVHAKVEAYCQRYGVSPGPQGLPPFPTGQRESRQHRDWLTVYRALQRFERRAAAASADAPDRLACPVCARPIEPGLAVPYVRRGRSARPASLHPSCAELARLAETLGSSAVAALGPFLWPSRRRGRPTSD